MSLTVTESQAVFDLLRWLADQPGAFDRKVTDERAIEALVTLGEAAGRRLQLSPERALPALIVERLQAADSDGAAQAVCRAIEKRPVIAHREAIAAFHEWRRLQDVELGERLRDQTVDT